MTFALGMIVSGLILLALFFILAVVAVWIEARFIKR